MTWVSPTNFFRPTLVRADSKNRKIKFLGPGVFEVKTQKNTLLPELQVAVSFAVVVRLERIDF